MFKILAVLNQLLALIKEFLKQQKNEQKSNDVEKANEDPTAWFNSHFDPDSDIMHNNNKNSDTPSKAKNNSQ